MTTRLPKLETRTARAKLSVRKKPYFVPIAPGISLGYRCNRRSAGPWIVRAADGQGGNWTKGFALADDFESANGGNVLDYWAAADKARALARSRDGDAGDRLVTVEEALNNYVADLKARRGDVYNARRARRALPKNLLNKTVALLTARELQRWRNSLIAAKGLAPATTNRTAGAAKAALELAARQDPRITNRDAWRIGLAALPDAERARNVVLADDKIRTIVATAYARNSQFGLLVEASAVTGARVSQLARLEVGDLQASRSDPRLMMPSSAKGRHKRIERRPVPIPAAFAARLKQAAAGRPAHAPLLTKPTGEPWQSCNHRHPFRSVVAKAGLDPDEATLYALRHSSIVRSLLAGVPTRLVAANHDTSVRMLERTYSRYIADHADALARKGLLDISAPSAGNNIVPLPQARG